MALCGPKLSICGMLTSIWGILMLCMLGIFFRIKSPSLIEDLPVVEAELFLGGATYLDGLYWQASNNCFIAAGIYVGVFIFSFIQHRINLRATYIMS